MQIKISGGKKENYMGYLKTLGNLRVPGAYDFLKGGSSHGQMPLGVGKDQLPSTFYSSTPLGGSVDPRTRGNRGTPQKDDKKKSFRDKGKQHFNPRKDGDNNPAPIPVKSDRFAAI